MTTSTIPTTTPATTTSPEPLYYLNDCNGNVSEFGTATECAHTILTNDTDDYRLEEVTFFAPEDDDNEDSDEREYYLTNDAGEQAYAVHFKGHGQWSKSNRSYVYAADEDEAREIFLQDYFNLKVGFP